MGYALRVVREVAGAPYEAGAPAAELAELVVGGEPAKVAQSAATGEAADPDHLEDLGDRITILAAHIHAASYRLLELIAEFDRLRGWERSGHRDCASWLHARAGFAMGAAREKVRVARALRSLPETSAAMARGELSFSNVRALTRVADAENESKLLGLARGCTTAQMEKMVRAWKKAGCKDEQQLERERYRSRTFSVFPDEDGMYVVRGRLTPEAAAVLMRAVEAASDALYKRERKEAKQAVAASEAGAIAAEEREHGEAGQAGEIADQHDEPVAGDERAALLGDVRVRRALGYSEKEIEEGAREAARRRADAVGLLAERALAAGFGGAGDPDAPISGTRAERYQVMVHVDAETLAGEGEGGRAELEDGTRVSAETARRLCCDAAVVRVTHGKDGSVLDVGRKTRSIPPALRRALDVRDQGCRFPGCGLRFTSGHHLWHWGRGGPTKLGNCLLLCYHHHRLVHEGGWKVDWWGEGRPVFHDPRGLSHYEGRWQPPALGAEPVEALIEENRARGADPDYRTAGARWRREEDIPSEVYFRALEAV